MDRELVLIAVEERCRHEGIVPTDVHYELLQELRGEKDEGSGQGIDCESYS